MDSDETLTIKDSKGGGKITGGYNLYDGDGGIYCMGTLILNGGTITAKGGEDGAAIGGGDGTEWTGGN